MSKETKEQYVYFWTTKGKYGCFSQWYISSFKDRDGVKYNCCEQYMMASKAKLFNDEQAYRAIMDSKTPKKIKDIGRQVKNFDETIWKKKRAKIVLIANIYKFTQNKKLQNILVSTCGSIIAEASPYDKIYGIGMRSHKGLVKSDWKGKNILGNVLMKVRTFIVTR